jgi:hypothetical protein
MIALNFSTLNSMQEKHIKKLSKNSLWQAQDSRLKTRISVWNLMNLSRMMKREEKERKEKKRVID